MSEGQKKVRDTRDDLVHLSKLEKAGHYEYDEVTLCGVNTSYYPYSFYPSKRTVTCLGCLAEEGSDD